MRGHGQRPKRWGRISWWHSSVLWVALLALLATVLISALRDDSDYSGVVRDAYTGEPVAGAQVSTAGTTVTTDSQGRFNLDTRLAGDISVSGEAYESTQVPAPADDTAPLAIELRPTTLSGAVMNSRSGEGMPGVTVEARGPDNAAVTAVTDQEGRYLLIDVPANAGITVLFDGYSQVTKEVGHNVVLDFEIRPDVVTGRVTDPEGQPVAGATVQAGEASTETDAQGNYRLGGAPESGTIMVKKAGYSDASGEFGESMTFDAVIESFTVKAIYVTALIAQNDASWQEMLAICEETEINAVVLDVKDNTGYVRYASQVQMAHDIGAVDPRFDLQKRLQELRDRGIYSIARVVVFEDPILADARPDLAIKDSSTGGLWETWNGLHWVNGHSREVWQYNVDIAVEVANAGFDEVQLDYIRFPTDGLVEYADYGTEYGDETRTEAITGFLEQMRTALMPTGVYLAVDIFGFTLWDVGDGGIGQELELIEPLVDVICPMIYPSHFAEGELGFDYPNDHPYEVILWSLESGRERIGDKAHKFRPWLQDFSYGPGIEYGAQEVLAQINASNEFSPAGWMLWNAGNVYHMEALQPAP